MKKLNALYVSLVALVLAVVALAMNIFCCTSKKSSVEEELMAKPQMIINAMQSYEEQQRAEALKKAEENIKANAEELYNRAGDGVMGNPDGKIVLVEFFDYSCGFCGRIYPVIKQIIAANPDLKVVANNTDGVLTYQWEKDDNYALNFGSEAEDYAAIALSR